MLACLLKDPVSETEVSELFTLFGQSKRHRCRHPRMSHNLFEATSSLPGSCHPPGICQGGELPGDPVQAKLPGGSCPAEVIFRFSM